MKYPQETHFRKAWKRGQNRIPEMQTITPQRNCEEIREKKTNKQS